MEAANRTKDHFLAMLSHELRTPLTPVISALEALEMESAQTGDAKTALAMIRRNRIPGIAISGFGNNGDIERSLQAGFSEHLIKPVQLEKLEAAIERALGAGAGSD